MPLSFYLVVAVTVCSGDLLAVFICQEFRAEAPIFT
jgi:hypothetical protein